MSFVVGMPLCESCLEQSYVFQVKAGDRMLYFQADLKRDSDRFYTAIDNASKVSKLKLVGSNY